MIKEYNTFITREECTRTILDVKFPQLALCVDNPEVKPYSEPKEVTDGCWLIGYLQIFQEGVNPFESGSLRNIRICLLDQIFFLLTSHA